MPSFITVVSKGGSLNETNFIYDSRIALSVLTVRSEGSYVALSVL